MKRVLAIICLSLAALWPAMLGPDLARAQPVRPPLTVPSEVVDRARRQPAPPAKPKDDELPLPMGDEMNRKRIQAALYLRRGETEKGLSLLAELVAKNPKNHELRMEYAENLLNAKKYAALDAQFKILRDQKPKDPRVNFLGARALAQKGEYAQADRILLDLLKDHPRQPEYLAEHGRAQLQMGNYDEALALFRRSLLIKPNQPWLHRDLARLTRENATRLTTRTLYVDQAHQTRFFRNEVALVGPVAQRLKLGLKWMGNAVERDDSLGSKGAKEQNHAVLATAEYRFSPRFKVGAMGGPVLQGPETFSFGLNADYVWPDKAGLKGLVEINTPWDDPVRAAESNGLVDRAQLEGEISALKNWVAGYSLEFRRYFLEKDRHYADRYIGSMQVGRVLFSRPYVLLSGTWYYSKVHQNDEFSQELLTPEENALGISLYTEARLSSYLTGWSSFAVRRDLAKDLTAVDAALGLRWQVLPYLMLKPAYFYTNDSESIGGGDSHNLLVETEFLF